jgi:hypothetical protein
MIPTTRLPEYLRAKSIPPPPTGDNPTRQVEWLRQHVRPLALYCAMMQVSGEETESASQSELCAAAIGTARDLGWDTSVAAAAARVEIPLALESVRKTADRILFAVRPKIDRREPAEEVLAAAKAADPAAMLPTEMLIKFCTRIAQSRMPRRVRT